jgi:hypothetical protein
MMLRRDGRTAHSLAATARRASSLPALRCARTADASLAPSRRRTAVSASATSCFSATTDSWKQPCASARRRKESRSRSLAAPALESAAWASGRSSRSPSAAWRASPCASPAATGADAVAGPCCAQVRTARMWVWRRAR